METLPILELGGEYIFTLKDKKENIFSLVVETGINGCTECMEEHTGKSCIVNGEQPECCPLIYTNLISVKEVQPLCDTCEGGSYRCKVCKE